MEAEMRPMYMGFVQGSMAATVAQTAVIPVLPSGG